MRSHPKASSLGSNLGRGKSRRPFRRSGALAALLVALTAAACLLPVSASAVELRTVTESFGPDGTSGSTFGFPGALGFDQGNKHLYALEGGEIHGFDASTAGSHTPLGGNFPLSTGFAGEFNGIAADPTSHHFYYATPEENTLYGYDQSGAALSGFPIGGQNYSCGTAVDSSGNVYVAEANEGTVREYSPAGALVETHTIGGEPCHLAFDSEDNLYVGNYYGATKKYTASSGYTSSTTIDPEFTSAMTVDKATGEVFVIHYNYIQVWDTEGEFLYELKGEPFGREFSAIAVNEATEELYVSDYGHAQIDVYSKPASLPKLSTEGADGVSATGATVHGTINPKEEPVEDCHFEVIPAAQFNATKYANVTAAQEFPCVPAAGSIPVDANPHPVSASVTGLSPATLYHYRLVATNPIGEAEGNDRTFTTGPVAPLLEGQSAEAVGTTEATVAARINPKGGQTTYHVEYGTTNAYGQTTPESAPFGFPTDNSKHPVSVHIGGLQPGTAYHFRFVATNEAGGGEGADTTFATYLATSPTFAPCPNDQFRTGLGAHLPDCRAYEQATPTDKHGSNAQGSIGSNVASASGNHLTFFANGGLPTTGGLSSLVPFIASRGPAGWSTDGLLPPTQPGRIGEVLGSDDDLSVFLVSGDGPGNVGTGLYLRDSDTAAFQPGPVGSQVFVSPRLGGFADDTSHYIFTVIDQLLPSAAPGKPNLYDVDHGALTLVDRIPSGLATSCDDESGPTCVVPPEGTERGPLPSISRDGSRVVFGTGPSSGGQIYLREDGARTTRISASQRTTPDPNGQRPTVLYSVTADGSKAFFTSCEKLTDDSTAVSNGENKCDEREPFKQGNDLYSYDAESGELTDLTVDTNAGDLLGAGVERVLGVSTDGSYVYFVARGGLAPGATSHNCRGIADPYCNLYVYHDGVTTFISKLRTDDHGAGTDPDGVRVAADGSVLLFRSYLSLTGFDTTGSCGGGACAQFYRYSASDEELVCVSCNPTNVPPNDLPRLGTLGSFLGKATGASLPRNISADGNRVFFESSEALILGDTNGVTDVYEWEAKGTGSCESESPNGGCLYLISSGTDPVPSQFLDASANGDHVFFFTEQQLVPADKDSLVDVYDAGVGAGLAAQHPLSPPTCASSACQANPTLPPDQTPASATFSGPGNAHKGASARKCPKGKRKVRRKGKVRCQKAHKQHKRHNNRGGAK